MNTENDAATDDTQITDNVTDNQSVDTGLADSAPQTQDNAPATQDQSKPVDGVQKKINKEVARRGAAERLVDKTKKENEELRLKLASYEQSAPQQTTALVMPKESDYDFDQRDKYNSDMVEFNKQVARNETLEVIASEKKEAEKKLREADFEKVKANFFAQPEALVAGFKEQLSTLPTFEPETLNLIMTTENGAKLATHLMNHLDVAYDIASLSSVEAGMRIGQIATGLANSKQPNKIDNAPDPVTTINQNGSVTGKEERHPLLKGATFT